MRLNGRFGKRAAAAGLVGAATIIGAAAPASAKSDISISITPSAINDGQSINIVVNGGDDAQQPVQQLCIDLRGAHGRWRTVRCRTEDITVGPGLVYMMRLRHCGSYEFRGQLLIPDGRHDRRHWVDDTSGPAIVTVR